MRSGGAAHCCRPSTSRYLLFFLVDSLTVVFGCDLTVDCFTKRPVIELRPREPELLLALLAMATSSLCKSESALSTRTSRGACTVTRPPTKRHEPRSADAFRGFVLFAPDGWLARTSMISWITDTKGNTRSMLVSRPTPCRFSPTRLRRTPAWPRSLGRHLGARPARRWPIERVARTRP
jgi:hypothetical protein